MVSVHPRVVEEVEGRLLALSEMDLYLLAHEIEGIPLTSPSAVDEIFEFADACGINESDVYALACELWEESR